MVSFGTFRHALIPKPVSCLGLFCRFLQPDGSDNTSLFFYTLVNFQDANNNFISLIQKLRIIVLLRKNYVDGERQYLLCFLHGLRMPSKEIVFTLRPKIHSHSQISRYSRRRFCLPHQLKFSDFFDLCLHWVSLVRGFQNKI